MRGIGDLVVCDGYRDEGVLVREWLYCVAGRQGHGEDNEKEKSSDLWRVPVRHFLIHLREPLF
jgi:hypothetical protein